MVVFRFLLQEVEFHASALSVEYILLPREPDPVGSLMILKHNHANVKKNALNLFEFSNEKKYHLRITVIFNGNIKNKE